MCLLTLTQSGGIRPPPATAPILKEAPELQTKTNGAGDEGRQGYRYNHRCDLDLEARVTRTIPHTPPTVGIILSFLGRPFPTNTAMLLDQTFMRLRKITGYYF